jgi:hypothetical protein
MFVAMTGSRNDERCCGHSQKFWTGARDRDSFLAYTRTDIVRTSGLEILIWEGKRKRDFEMWEI